MGRIRHSALLEEAMGQVGDVVFSKTKDKQYIKKKGKKKNNHTKARERTESLFNDLPKVWAGMKRRERRTWEKLCKSGHVFKNTKSKEIKDGMNLFVSLNRNLQEAEEPMLRIAPETPVFPPEIHGSIIEIIIKNDGTDIILFNQTVINKDIKVILYATPILTSGKDIINRRLYRKIDVIDSEFENGSSISEQYFKVFKNIPEEGDEISIIFKSVNRSIGTVSLPLTYDATTKRQLIPTPTSENNEPGT